MYFTLESMAGNKLSMSSYDIFRTTSAGEILITHITPITSITRHFEVRDAVMAFGYPNGLAPVYMSSKFPGSELMSTFATLYRPELIT